jgi:phospholipase C
MHPTRRISFSLASVLAIAGTAIAVSCTHTPPSSGAPSAASAGVATPIEHLVVIFDENNSFDHYFGVYPIALNPPGQPKFVALPNTPAINGLTEQLRKQNPNFLNKANDSVASNPFRIDRTQAGTASQDHRYMQEQLAYNNGRADLFPKYTGRPTPGAVGTFATKALVMGYFDGNTVTALWNYAQHFAMSDNHFGAQYGPSTPGAINLVSGQTSGMLVKKHSDSSVVIPDGQGTLFTLTNDAAPAIDICSDSISYWRDNEITATGKNIGNLLTAANVTWGWFQGGFDLTRANAAGVKGCTRTTKSTIAPGTPQTDYLPHHEPFQYYPSTANPTHTRPSSVSLIGTSNDGANHQYDLHDFFDAVSAGNFPAVSYIKARAFQDGHGGYSDPLDEQNFIVGVLNFLQQRPEWSKTAVIIMYDDSDGWYDHAYTPPTNASFNAKYDRLTSSGACGVKGQTAQLGGPADKGPVNGRCGPGARLPLLVVSPWAKQNYVDHTLLTQASVLRFVENNWLKGQRLGGGSFDANAADINTLFDFAHGGRTPVLFLDDSTGVPVSKPSNRLPY